MGEDICTSCIHQTTHQTSVQNWYRSTKDSNKKKKQTKELGSQFSNEDIHMAHRQTKKGSTSLITRKIQIKTTARVHLTPEIALTSQEMRGTGAVVEKELCHTGGDSAICYCPL